MFVLVFGAIASAAVSPSSTHLCPYSTEVFELMLEPGAYGVSLGGDAAGWASIAEGEIVSDSTPIPIFLTVPCDMEVGEYKLLVVAEGEKPVEEAVTIFVDNCFGVELGLDREQVSVCKGGSASVKASFKNVGKYAEGFVIKAGGEQIAALELGPDEEKSVEVDVNSGRVAGKANVWVEAFGPKSGTKIGRNILVTTQDCYKTTVIGPARAEYCAGEQGILKLTILNEGIHQVQYSTALTGANGAVETGFALEPGAETEVTVVFTDNPAGEYNAVVGFENEGGKEAKNVALKVNECRGFEVVADEFVGCAGEGVTAPITVRNTGAYNGAYTLTVENGLAEVQTFYVDVEAGAFKIIDYYFLVPEGVEGLNEIKITTAGQKESIVKTVNYDVKAPDACYKVSIAGGDSYTVTKGTGKLAKVTLMNEGLVDEDIALSTDKEWAYLKPDLVSVEAGKSERAQLYLGPGFEVEDGEYAVAVFAQGEKTGASKEVVVTVTQKRSFIPTGLVSLPSFGGDQVSVETIAYFLWGLGITIIVLLVALVLWEE